jgi:hypothetical protein
MLPSEEENEKKNTVKYLFTRKGSILTTYSQIPNLGILADKSLQIAKLQFNLNLCLSSTSRVA